MLAAEHTEQQGVELCPVCRRFPLAADVPLDLSQWDYATPDLQDVAEPNALETTSIVDSMPEQALESSEDWILEEAYEEPGERVRTCYHCYQAEAGGLAELCPVCGDSYLPPSLRTPHMA